MNATTGGLNLEHAEAQYFQPTSPLWDSSTDRIFRKALHDYKLVINYEMQSMGGKRWLPSDISYIRQQGRMLQQNIAVLIGWKDEIEATGWVSERKSVIDRKISLVKAYCERVLASINDCEQHVSFTWGQEIDSDGHLINPQGPGYLSDRAMGYRGHSGHYYNN